MSCAKFTLILTRINGDRANFGLYASENRVTLLAADALLVDAERRASWSSDVEVL